MRDYSRFDKYVSALQQDVYPQPVDEAHLEWATDAIMKLVPEGDTVLDVGCGEGFTKPIFESIGRVWTGLTIGEEDYDNAKKAYPGAVLQGDFTFTHFQDEMFDIVFARHALEHSPFPIITLMEWHRIARESLVLVAPAPEYWKYAGKNHYAVANEDQLWWWLRRAGWKVEVRDYLRTSDPSFVRYYLPEEKDREKVAYPGAPKLVEYRYLCSKVEPIDE